MPHLTAAHTWRKPRQGTVAHAIRPEPLHRLMPMAACGADFRRGLVDYAPGMPLCPRCAARVTPPALDLPPSRHRWRWEQ